MRKISLTTIILFCCLVSTTAFAQAPEGAGPGPVWRVTLYKIKPGKMNESMRELREHFKPMFDELKKQGAIVDYKVYTNITRDSSADWDMGIAIGFKNFAALDELGRKTNAVAVQHFGSEEKALAAAEQRRELRETISVRLMREANLNPRPQRQAAQTKQPQQP
jgi:hypothetical protein